MGGLLSLGVPFLALTLVAIILILIFASCIKIVPQATAMVIERLGGYQEDT